MAVVAGPVAAACPRRGTRCVDSTAAARARRWSLDDAVGRGRLSECRPDASDLVAAAATAAVAAACGGVGDGINDGAGKPAGPPSSASLRPPEWARKAGFRGTPDAIESDDAAAEDVDVPDSADGTRWLDGLEKAEERRDLEDEAEVDVVDVEGVMDISNDDAGVVDLPRSGNISHDDERRQELFNAPAVMTESVGAPTVESVDTERPVVSAERDGKRSAVIPRRDGGRKLCGKTGRL